MRFLTIAAIAVVALQACAGEDTNTITGTARVTDGNTIALDLSDALTGDLIEIRLLGIAAPKDSESTRWTGGPESTAHLKELVEGQTVSCDLDGSASFERLVATCYFGDIDMAAYQEYASGNLKDEAMNDEEMAMALAALPKVQEPVAAE